ncbi:MAG: Transcriptional activator protein CopR [Acidobacteriota bacterium]|jgi:DNA-binding response OmpR family regulator
MVPWQVLVADDEPVSRTVVGAMLKKAGYPVLFAPDGEQAWQHLSTDDPPAIALLDWEMPGLQGPEIVQRLRARESSTPTYVILLTSRDSSADIVQGLRAGADDYVTKPANEDELLARVNVGTRVVQLQTALADRVRSLEDALANVKALQTLLPMCAYCKSIRNDQNYWEKVETYFTQHSNVSFTHSYCPNCYERFVRPELEALEDARAAQERQRRR